MLPQLSHFYSGAIHAANVDEYTTREIAEYVAYMNAYQEAELKAVTPYG